MESMRLNPHSTIFSDSDKPKFPFDDLIADYKSEIDECPSCGKSLSEHTRKERIRCALARVQGVPHH
jgi:hypothetical protein